MTLAEIKAAAEAARAGVGNCHDPQRCGKGGWTHCKKCEAVLDALDEQDWLVERCEALEAEVARLKGYPDANVTKAEPDPLEGLPQDLADLLRDPTITIPRDHEIRLADGRTLFEHLEEWRNAPSNTASALARLEGE